MPRHLLVSGIAVVFAALLAASNCSGDPFSSSNSAPAQVDEGDAVSVQVGSRPDEGRSELSQVASIIR